VLPGQAVQPVAWPGYRQEKVTYFFIQTGRLRQGRIRFRLAFILDIPWTFQYQTPKYFGKVVRSALV
jgi:hypothetical protein